MHQIAGARPRISYRKKEELYYGSGQPCGAIRARLLNRVLGLPVVGRVGTAPRSVCVVLCALLRVLLCVPLCTLLCALLRAPACALWCALSGVPLSCVLFRSAAPSFYSGCSFRAEFPFASPVSALLMLPSACWFGRRVVFSRPRPSSSLFMMGTLSAPGCQAADSHRGGPSVS